MAPHEPVYAPISQAKLFVGLIDNLVATPLIQSICCVEAIDRSFRAMHS